MVGAKRRVNMRESSPIGDVACRAWYPSIATLRAACRARRGRRTPSTPRGGRRLGIARVARPLDAADAARGRPAAGAARRRAAARATWCVVRLPDGVVAVKRATVRVDGGWWVERDNPDEGVDSARSGRSRDGRRAGRGRRAPVAAPAAAAPPSLAGIARSAGP